MMLHNRYFYLSTNELNTKKYNEEYNQKIVPLIYEMLKPKQEIMLIEQPKQESKKLKFSYDPEWKKEIHDLYKSTRKTNKQDFKDRQTLLFQLQKEYDLFPTPETLTKEIINDFEIWKASSNNKRKSFIYYRSQISTL
jgi:hypothetical protein